MTTISSPAGFFWNDATTPETATDLQSVLTDLQISGAAAEAAASAASTSATAAASAATSATSAASSAVTAVNSAVTSAEATISASVTSATTALSTATATATSAASAASSSASTAATSATTAGTSATAAGTSATAAAASATAAAGSASGASTSATNAATSAASAATSATSASNRVAKAGDSMTGSLFGPQFVQTGTTTPGLQIASTSKLLGNTLVNPSTTSFPTSPDYNSSPLQVKTSIANSTTVVGSNPVAVIWVPTDTATPASGDISGLLVNMAMSTGSSGFRNGINVTMNAAQSGITHADVLPVVGTGTIQVNVGGTDTTQGGSSGIAWGANFVAQALGTATNLSGVVGMELDVVAANGTSMHDKHGLSVIQLPAPSATVAGPQGVIDYAIGVSNGSTAGNPTVTTPAWKNGVLFGMDDGWWPFDTNSAIVHAVPSVDFLTTGTPVGYGVDFIHATFSKYAFRTAGFSVDGSGVTQIGAGVLSPISTGLSIDAKGVIATAVSVAAGGSGYHIGDMLRFGNGGLASITTVSGTTVTSLTVITYPFQVNAAAEPSNPVATTTWSRGTGSGLTVNITWDATRTTLSLNPTGGAVTAGGSVKATGGIAAFGVSPPSSRPSITGSRGSATASVLAQVLTAMAGAGLLIDNTTA